MLMRSRRTHAGLLALALALGACAKAPDPAVAPAPRLAEGQAFPSFMLDFLRRGDGGTALRGKMLVLNVWASWCPPCRREMPGLDRLSRTLDRRRFAVVGLSTDDDGRLAAEFLQQQSVSFANFLDQGGAMAHRLGLQVYPETFVIAPDGTLLARMTGLQDWDDPAVGARLERLYQARLNGTAAKMGM
jgi:thiol-disulfide isomerase/thioredoxin